MTINLDDYDITIECLSNVADNDIEKWISNSSKPKKVNRNLEMISKLGGSFTSNGLDAISSESIDVPFLIENGDKKTIHYGKARVIRFYPVLEKIQFNVHETNHSKKETNDTSITNNNEATNNKKSKKRSHNNLINVKEEALVHDINGVETEYTSSPKNKKRKVDTNNNADVAEEDKSKRKKSNTDKTHASKPSDILPIHDGTNENNNNAEKETFLNEVNAPDSLLESKKQHKKKKKVKLTDADSISIKKEKIKANDLNILNTDKINASKPLDNLQVNDVTSKDDNDIENKALPKDKSIADVPDSQLSSKKQHKKTKKLKLTDAESLSIKKEKVKADDLNLSSKFVTSDAPILEKAHKKKKRKINSTDSVLLSATIDIETNSTTMDIKKKKKVKFEKI